MLVIPPQISPPPLFSNVFLTDTPSSFYLSPLLQSPSLTRHLRLLGGCYYSITLHLDNHRLATPNWSAITAGCMQHKNTHSITSFNSFSRCRKCNKLLHSSYLVFLWQTAVQFISLISVKFAHHGIAWGNQAWNPSELGLAGFGCSLITFCNEYFC